MIQKTDVAMTSVFIIFSQTALGAALRDIYSHPTLSFHG